MDNRRRSSVCSSVMSGSSDVSMYHNCNHLHKSNNSSSEAVLKIERSVESPPIVDESGRRNFFLRWKGFEGNLIRMVEGLKFGRGLSDVTLSCDGGYKAHLHKLILASASLYLYQIFEEVAESKHPLIILSGINSDILELLVTYMYCGFIDVPKDKLAELISAGKSLKIKGLMDMKEEVSETSAMDVLPQPPPAHLSNGPASTSSFMMSPLSEPRLTPTFAQTSYLHHHHRQPQPLLSLTNTWPAGDSLHLLATAAHMRSSSEEEERSSSAEPSPLPLQETSGHSGISAVSAASAIAASRGSVTRKRRDPQMPYFRYDRENEENDPTHGPSSSSENSNQSISDLRVQDNRAINLSIRSCEPLTPLNTNFSSTGTPIGPLLNIPNPSAFWPKHKDLSSTGFRPLAASSSPAAPSSGDSSQNSSPLDFSNWRLGSDYSVQRLFANHNESTSSFVNPMSQISQLSRVGGDSIAAAADNNRTALMAVAAAISAAAASAAVSAASSDRSLSVPLPSAQSPSDGAPRRGPRHSRGPRRSAPSMSGSGSGPMMSPHPKCSSPTNTGANWKSRQPTECDFCKRMFSNKFNLKQHILNMHSTGGEVRCEQCGKTVKNKWYLRRHKVTHHGAPLRKYKKEHDFGSGGDRHNMDQSDNEDGTGEPGSQLVIQP